MKINYDHQLNPHRSDDGEIIIPILFADHTPESMLDVGCGTGTWTKAARDNGVKSILGIDGNSLGSDAVISSAEFKIIDLSQKWNLNRNFELLFCLEVAEHLDESCAEVLIESLTQHSDQIIFSAACPGQAGQHHVNCQWPEYWQKLFNMYGYTCDDSIRPKIWANRRVAPWYRQNMFVAKRDRENAGNEPRLPSLLHPDMFDIAQHCTSIQDYQTLIESGLLPYKWYAMIPFKATWEKLKRRVLSRNG